MQEILRKLYEARALTNDEGNARVELFSLLSKMFRKEDIESIVGNSFATDFLIISLAKDTEKYCPTIMANVKSVINPEEVLSQYANMVGEFAIQAKKQELRDKHKEG